MQREKLSGIRKGHLFEFAFEPTQRLNWLLALISTELGPGLATWDRDPPHTQVAIFTPSWRPRSGVNEENVVGLSKLMSSQKQSRKAARNVQQTWPPLRLARALTEDACPVKKAKQVLCSILKRWMTPVSPAATRWKG